MTQPLGRTWTVVIFSSVKYMLSIYPNKLDIILSPKMLCTREICNHFQRNLSPFKIRASGKLLEQVKFSWAKDQEIERKP